LALWHFGTLALCITARPQDAPLVVFKRYWSAFMTRQLVFLHNAIISAKSLRDFYVIFIAAA
jgi:hypothetical protein